MQSKIVYISSAKIQNPNDIQTVFDQIRTELELSDDVVLFGVPTESGSTVNSQQSTEDVVVPFVPLPVVSSEETTIIIEDEVVVPEPKKTLEELFGSVKPLTEDNMDDDIIDTVPESPEPKIDSDILKNLATEFIEQESTIAPAKTATGKIGKIKNILPFKKSKKEDGGLMGDLFGWAGIAANEDNFEMPGFFG